MEIRNFSQRSETVVNLTIRHLTSIVAKGSFLFLVGPEMWKVLHTDWTCQGRKQSPISLKTEDVVNDTMCKNIAIRVEPEGRPLRGILRNNGHAPTFSLTSNTIVRLFGGLLPNDYFLKQLHFHFGCENKKGSEHRIDGQSFPMEVGLCTIVKSQNPKQESRCFKNLVYHLSKF